MSEGAVPVITIDGAGGTGKGTVAHKIASQLGWHCLDSGVLYRVLALAAIQQNIPDTQASDLGHLAENLDVTFSEGRVFLSGQEVTAVIRTETIGNAASRISALPVVRTALLDRQRTFRQPPGLVTDGRDMGTVIFPDAALKIFLTASAPVRAQRRYLQLKAQGIDVNLCDLVLELEQRDRRDQERSVAPLKPAAYAVCIDTDLLSADEVVERIRLEVERVFGAAL